MIKFGAGALVGAVGMFLTMGTLGIIDDIKAAKAMNDLGTEPEPPQPLGGCEPNCSCGCGQLACMCHLAGNFRRNMT